MAHFVLKTTVLYLADVLCSFTRLAMLLKFDIEILFCAFCISFDPIYILLYSYFTLKKKLERLLSDKNYKWLIISFHGTRLAV